MALPTPKELQYQLDHVHDDRAKDIVVSNSICISLAALAVVLRFSARRLSKAKVGADDYMITAALLFAAGEITAGLLCVRFGGAKHAITLTNPSRFAKGAIATELFYCAAIASVKLSCLLLYRRLFPMKGFIRILWSVGGFIVLYTIVQICLIIFQCSPISRAWNPSIKAECINIGTATTAVAALNVATDFSTLTLPLPLIWGLQLPTAQKLQVSGIFLLGSFVCVVSIYRTTIIGKLSLADASWSDVDPCVWSAVEVCVGIVTREDERPAMRPQILKGA
ncbi:MAG: hypothetical protein Q9223_001958 [Gallowayella weberi]